MFPIIASVIGGIVIGRAIAAREQYLYKKGRQAGRKDYNEILNDNDFLRQENRALHTQARYAYYQNARQEGYSDGLRRGRQLDEAQTMIDTYENGGRAVWGITGRREGR